MLTGRLRALGVAGRALLAPRSTVSTLSFRVLPTDVDLNVHLTNSRYPQLMDMGRLDLLTRGRVLGRMMREGARPMAVEVHLRFLRELPLGARFRLHTRLTGTDRKAVVFEQRFLSGPSADPVEHAVGTVKVLVVQDGVVRPEPWLGTLLPDGAETDAVA